jgi:hypothetical protein
VYKRNRTNKYLNLNGKLIIFNIHLLESFGFDLFIKRLIYYIVSAERCALCVRKVFFLLITKPNEGMGKAAQIMKCICDMSIVILGFFFLLLFRNYFEVINYNRHFNKSFKFQEF